MNAEDWVREAINIDLTEHQIKQIKYILDNHNEGDVLRLQFRRATGPTWTLVRPYRTEKDNANTNGD